MNKIHKLTMSERYLAAATFHTMNWWEMILYVPNGQTNKKIQIINKIMKCSHHNKIMTYNRKIIHQKTKISKTIFTTKFIIHLKSSSNNKTNKITNMQTTH